jgi:hypothetical protein
MISSRHTRLNPEQVNNAMFLRLVKKWMTGYCFFYSSMFMLFYFEIIFMYLNYAAFISWNKIVITKFYWKNLWINDPWKEILCWAGWWRCEFFTAPSITAIHILKAHSSGYKPRSKMKNRVLVEKSIFCMGGPPYCKTHCFYTYSWRNSIPNFSLGSIRKFIFTRLGWFVDRKRNVKIFLLIYCFRKIINYCFHRTFYCFDSTWAENFV